MARPAILFISFLAGFLIAARSRRLLIASPYRPDLQTMNMRNGTTTNHSMAAAIQ